MIHSVLDDIKGLGPKRKAVLHTHYKDIEEISKSSEKEIAHKCNFSLTLANAILENIKASQSPEKSET